VSCLSADAIVHHLHRMRGKKCNFKEEREKGKERLPPSSKPAFVGEGEKKPEKKKEGRGKRNSMPPGGNVREKKGEGKKGDALFRLFRPNSIVHEITEVKKAYLAQGKKDSRRAF